MNSIHSELGTVSSATERSRTYNPISSVPGSAEEEPRAHYENSGDYIILYPLIMFVYLNTHSLKWSRSGLATLPYHISRVEQHFKKIEHSHVTCLLRLGKLRKAH